MRRPSGHPASWSKHIARVFSVNTGTTPRTRRSWAAILTAICNVGCRAYFVATTRVFNVAVNEADQDHSLPGLISPPAVRSKDICNEWNMDVSIASVL